MKKIGTVKYPNLPSTIQSIPHSDSLPVPTPPQSYKLEAENEGKNEVEIEEKEENKPSTSNDPDFVLTDDVPHRLNQAELSNLAQDLNLSQEKAGLLGSSLKQWNLLQFDIKGSHYRKRQQNLLSFLEKRNNLVCIDVIGLMYCLNLNYDSTEWRLFIVSSNLILKAV